MPTYVTVVKAPAESLKTMGDIGKWYEDNKAELQRKGIRHIAAYALLGRYDMMFIYEAPDEEVAAGMAVSMATKWGGGTETWTVIPMEEFVKLAERLKG